jgi:hypothetical protein
MGVSLSYQTTKPVSAAVKKAILADAARLNVERSWWCENFIFFEAAKRKKKGPTPLTGDTKLYLPGYTWQRGYVEVEFEDDQFMAERDTAFIIQQLVKWSRKHSINWTVSMAGVELGAITNGEVQPEGLFQWDHEETPAERRRAARIDRKYASRNG